MKYNEKLRVFFKSKNLTQRELSDILGHAPAMISRYLSGESKFGPEFIVSMIKAFPDLDLKYIFSNDKENIVLEPKPFYGLNEDNIDEELKLIEKKVANVREYLAQKNKN